MKNQSDVQLISYDRIVKIPGVTIDNHHIASRAFVDSKGKVCAIERIDETIQALILPIITDPKRLEDWQGTVTDRR